MGFGSIVFAYPVAKGGQLKAIEAVVPWVDDSNPQWLEQRKSCKLPSPFFVDHSGFYKNWGLIDLCLASLLKNADWISRITIVTGGDGPTNLASIQSLNPSIPIRIVREKDFIPEQYLPVFNCYAIDTFLHLIPDLGDHFLVVNDDMFFAKPTSRFDYLSAEDRILFGSQKRWFEERSVASLTQRAHLRLLHEWQSIKAGRLHDRLLLKLLRLWWKYSPVGLRSPESLIFGKYHYYWAKERSSRLYLSRFPHSKFIDQPHFPNVLNKQDVEFICATFPEEIELCRRDQLVGWNALELFSMVLSHANSCNRLGDTSRSELYIGLTSDIEIVEQELSRVNQFDVVCLNDEVGSEATEELENIVHSFIQRQSASYRK